jgi:hypothetical protein
LGALTAPQERLLNRELVARKDSPSLFAGTGLVPEHALHLSGGLLDYHDLGPAGFGPNAMHHLDRLSRDGAGDEGGVDDGRAEGAAEDRGAYSPLGGGGGKYGRKARVASNAWV